MTTEIHPSTQTRSNSDEKSPFLFVGNGPYRNRGCEAIIRGTMEILSKSFGAEIQARAGVMASPATVATQQSIEVDDRVANFSVSHVGGRLSAKWFLSQANQRLGTNFGPHVRDLVRPSKGVSCALQLGGDNYSLDYGRPWDYMAIDKYLQRLGVPIILWGASVGPFESDLEFAPLMYEHLKGLTAIFVRESRSQNYLASKGIVDNVYLVADPAFCMSPVAPKNLDARSLVSKGTIGINISPLVARFSHTKGDLDEWRKNAAEMIIATAKRTERPILLVPHVGSPQHDEDDYSFMSSVFEIVAPQIKSPIKIAPADLLGAEMKWLIGQCEVFAGARTHSTIAALSSCVPTLSLGYSIKAIGINQDIFGHQEFCKSVKTLSVDEFSSQMAALVAEADSIRSFLERKIPIVKNTAQSAGEHLKAILGR